MKKMKRVVYQVQCALNPKHVFEKVYLIEQGSENKQTDVNVYCPLCDAYVDITIQGKLVMDEVILREIKNNPEI